MSATDELRKLLDDRAVDWRKWSGNSKRKTQWFMPNSNIGSNAPGSYCVTVEEHKDGSLFFKSMIASPEQAIAITLGHSLNNPSMSETLSERGTCHIIKKWSDSDFIDDWKYICSECGCFIPVNERDEETGDVISVANYCPNCGRKVEG